MGGNFRLVNAPEAGSANPDSNSNGLLCPACGEWIETVGDPARVQCGECGAQLTLNVAARKARDQLRALDEAWRVRRKPYLVKNRHGEWEEPDTSAVGFILPLVPGSLFTLVGAAVGRPSLMVTGALILVVGIGWSARRWAGLERFRQEQLRYNAERHQLMLELGRAQRAFASESSHLPPA